MHYYLQKGHSLSELKALSSLDRAFYIASAEVEIEEQKDAYARAIGGES